ncbi:MAG: hypothetical protein IT247_05475 [Bacteroidia bacterium]|nr:hypothetical protein [Bacteroidia bacterium]
MKIFFAKKKTLILTAFVILGVSFVVFASLQKSHPTKGIAQDYQQTALATIFAPTEHPPVVELTSVQANSTTLTIVLTVSGLELVKNPDDFENIICDPYIRTDKPVQLILNYREGEIPSQVGEPIVITYEYSMDSKEYKSLNVEMDISIGPCGPHFQESSVTPYPVDLIANYKLSFVVSIK